MAWRRLASGAAAAHLRRGGSSPSFAPVRTFSASCGPAAASPTLPVRHALQGIWSRCSSSTPAFQARAPMLRALLAARVSPGVRPKLPGLLRGFGTGGAAIAVMLYPTKVAEAQERPAKSPSEDITVLSPYAKQVLRKFWNLVRKFQLPIGLILLIVYGWRKPMVLAINTLLLLYSTRPDPYSIYLFPIPYTCFFRRFIKGRCGKILHCGRRRSSRQEKLIPKTTSSFLLGRWN